MTVVVDSSPPPDQSDEALDKQVTERTVISENTSKQVSIVTWCSMYFK